MMSHAGSTWDVGTGARREDERCRKIRGGSIHVNTNRTNQNIVAAHRHLSGVGQHLCNGNYG